MANIGDQMAAEAYNHVGKPYVWATHGPNSFDCSGLVHWVVLQVTGTWIAPGTAAQKDMGTLVSPVPSALRPGDLLFYTDPPGGSNVTHVGIFIEPGVMIDADNESTGVRITGPFGSWYGERFMFARRLYPYDDSQAPGAPDPDPPAPTIETGDVATGAVPVFQSTDPAGAVSLIDTIERLCVTGAVITVGGVDFLPVQVQATAVDGYLILGTAALEEKGGCLPPDPDPDPDPPADPYPTTPSQWAPGDRIEVVDGNLNTRSSYPSGGVIGTYQTGEQMCMVDGPAAANGYTWIKVEGRLSGWIAGDFCKRIGIQTCGGDTPPDPDPDPPANWTHKVTGSNLNLRATPSGTLMGTMPIGTKLRVFSGPVSQGGHTWYEVEAELFGHGWCVNGFDAI